MKLCARCESVGRKVPNKGTHNVIGPNGIKTVICDVCLKELEDDDVLTYYMEFRDEIENDEEVS